MCDEIRETNQRPTRERANIRSGWAGQTHPRRLGLPLAGLLLALLAGCGVTNASGQGGSAARATATAQAQATATAQAAATATAAAPTVRMTISVTEQGTLAGNGQLAATATITNATARPIHLNMPLCKYPLLRVALDTASGQEVWHSQGYIVCNAVAASHYDDTQTVAAGASATTTSATHLIEPGMPLQAGQIYTVQAQVLWRYQAGIDLGPETPQPVTAQTSITLR